MLPICSVQFEPHTRSAFGGAPLSHYHPWRTKQSLHVHCRLPPSISHSSSQLCEAGRSLTKLHRQASGWDYPAPARVVSSLVQGLTALGGCPRSRIISQLFSSYPHLHSILQKKKGSEARLLPHPASYIHSYLLWSWPTSCVR